MRPELPHVMLNGVKRSRYIEPGSGPTSAVSVEVEWPKAKPDWDELTIKQRNAIRDKMDELVDLVHGILS